MLILVHFNFWIVLAQQGGGGGGPLDGIWPFLPFIVIGILFYLMLIRPERRKRAEMTEMIGNMKANDRVVTIGGIYGTVVSAPKEGDYVTIRVDESNNTKLRILRTSVARVLTDKDGSEKSDK